MANSNANYLINPNRLSTKVHYAPGGASSLSLAWDEGVVNSNKKQKNRVIETPPFKYKSETPTNISNKYQYKQQQPQVLNKKYYEPAYPGYLDLSQSNRILEQELQYYQNRNKMLRSNIFGGQQNTELINKQSIRYPQYSQSNQYAYKPLDYSQSLEYGYKSDELDNAIYNQQRKREMEKQSNYNEYSFLPYGSQAQEKTSVKVSNPPGGRSSIVFG